jgi:hypothetical protein
MYCALYARVALCLTGASFCCKPSRCREHIDARSSPGRRLPDRRPHPRPPLRTLGRHDVGAMADG